MAARKSATLGSRSRGWQGVLVPPRNEHGSRPRPLRRPLTLAPLRERLSPEGARLVPREADARGERLKPAAVAAVLREGDAGLEVLLIRRAPREGDPWSGHMAFPGGRWEPRDLHLLDTARRETLEELGLDLEAHGALLGRLPEVRSPGHPRVPTVEVTPYVFELRGEPPPLTLAAGEVAEALWAPLEPMITQTSAITHPWDYRPEAGGPTITLRFPAWDVEGRTVWGMTQRMLESLFELGGW